MHCRMSKNVEQTRINFDHLTGHLIEGLKGLSSGGISLLLGLDLGTSRKVVKTCWVGIMI